MPSFMSKYLIKAPLQKNFSTYSMIYGQTNPMYTSQYKLSTINTQCIVCSATGPNNVYIIMIIIIIVTLNKIYHTTLTILLENMNQ